MNAAETHELDAANLCSIFCCSVLTLDVESIFSVGHSVCRLVVLSQTFVACDSRRFDVRAVK